MSRTKIKSKKKPRNFKKAVKSSISELEGFKNVLHKLTQENQLLNGEASDVLEEILQKIKRLEERVDELEKNNES